MVFDYGPNKEERKALIDAAWEDMQKLKRSDDYKKRIQFQKLRRNMELGELLKEWHTATAMLPWGVQNVFREALKAAEEGDVTLQYGADYGSDGQPCLVNATATMLASLQGVGGHGKPSKNFGSIVSLFDRINFKVDELRGYEGPKVVSHFAANMLVRHFALPAPEEAARAAHEQDVSGEPYKEISDDQLMKEWVEALRTDAPKEETSEQSIHALDPSPVRTDEG